MKRKLKSFFEDFLTLAVIVGIIYASYTYFFDDEHSNFENSHENKVVIQDSFKAEIEEPNQDLAILNKVFDKNEDEEDESIDEIINNSINDDPISNNDISSIQPSEKPIEEDQELVESNLENSSKFKLIETSKHENSSSSQEQEKKDRFYSNLREIILNNLNQLKSDDIEKNSFVNFRVTILKDGRYEQIFFDGGNEKLFNLSKNTVSKVFPLNIDSELKHLFPRYYRFKIEFN